MARVALLLLALAATALAVPVPLQRNVAERTETPGDVDSELFSLLERDETSGSSYLTEEFIDAFLERSGQVEPCCDAQIAEIAPTIITAEPLPSIDPTKPSAADLCFAEPFEADDEEECAKLGDKCPENGMQEIHLRILREERMKTRQREEIHKTVDCLSRASTSTMKELIHVDAMAAKVRSKYNDLQRTKATIKAQLEQARRTVEKLNEEERKEEVRIEAAQAATDKAAQKRILLEEEQSKKEQKLAFGKFKEEQEAKKGIQKSILESQHKHSDEQNEKHAEQERLHAKHAAEQAKLLKAQLEKVKEQEQLTKQLLAKEGNEAELKAKIRENINALANLNEQNLKKSGYKCGHVLGCSNVNTDSGPTTATAPFRGEIEPSYGKVKGGHDHGHEHGHHGEHGESSSKKHGKSESSHHGESSHESSLKLTGNAVHGFLNGKPIKTRIDDPVKPKYVPRSSLAIDFDELNVGKSKHKFEMHTDSVSHSGSSSSHHESGSSELSESGSHESGSSSKKQKFSKTVHWVPRHHSKHHRPVVQMVDKLGPPTPAQIVSSMESSGSITPDLGSDGGHGGSQGGDDLLGGDDGGGGHGKGANIIINIKGDGGGKNAHHHEESHESSTSHILNSLVSKLSHSLSSLSGSKHHESGSKHHESGSKHHESGHHESGHEEAAAEESAEAAAESAVSAGDF